MKLMNIKEAAKCVGLSEYELRKGIKQGKYPFIKAGETKHLVSVEALEKAIALQMEENRQRAQRSFEDWQRNRAKMQEGA